MTQFRWKKVILPAVLSTLLATAGTSLAQRGGGWGGGGSGGPGGGGGFGGGGGPGGGGSMRGGMSSDSSFDRLLQSYGGSGDTLDYSKVPADARQRMDTFAKMTGGQPMPTSGTLSRAQFKVDFDTRMQAMQSRMGRGPGGPTAPPPVTGATAGTPGSPQIVMVGPGGADTKTTMTMSTGPGQGGPGGGWGGAPGGGGGWGGGNMDPDALFKAMDINPADGKVSREEAMSSRSSRLGRSFDQHDTNKDGFIDQSEYKVYFSAAMGGMSGGGDRGGDRGGNWGDRGGNGGNPWNNMQDPNKQPPVEVEEEKPVIVRYGKLPTGMPEWFTAADTNRDAQISLFEYCRFFSSGADQVLEFKNQDLNGDSLLTAEEYLRHMKSKTSNGAPNLNGYSAPILANPVPGAPPARGGFGPGGGGPTPAFGPPPAGTTPTAPTGTESSRDRSGMGKDREKDKEKDAKTESKDQRGSDRGNRTPGSDRSERGNRTPSSGASNPFNPSK